MLRVLIQAAAGSCEQRIYNESTLEYLNTRPAAAPYPYPYGFVIGTTAADGDCVDCYLITTERPHAEDIVACEPIGLLHQLEDGKPDHKVIATRPGDAALPHDHLFQELQIFITTLFRAYIDTQVQVGPLLPRAAAWDYLRAARGHGEDLAE